MAEGFIAKNGITVSAAWTATQTNAAGVRVTDDMVIPEKGIWLFIVGIPIVDNENIIFSFYGSIINIPSSSAMYFPGRSQNKYCMLCNITADNAQVYLRTSGSTVTNYSNIDRGFISAVKLS